MSDFWTEDVFIGMMLGGIIVSFGALILWTNIVYYDNLHNAELKKFCNDKFYYYDGHMNDCDTYRGNSTK